MKVYEDTPRDMIEATQTTSLAGQLDEPGAMSGLPYVPVHEQRSDRLDLLRAALALYVMLVHALPWACVAQGAEAAPALLLHVNALLLRVFQHTSETNPGVLAFIVLSGYCIHRGGFRVGRFDLTIYRIRRFFRIYPLYVLAVAAGIVGWSISTQLSPSLGQQLSGTQEITSSCVLLRMTGLAAIYPPRCPLGNAPLNTVMAEIWLYIAYPALFMLALRKGERVLWKVVVAVWLVGLAWLIILPDSADHRAWWQTSSLAGFLLFWWIGAKALDAGFQRTLFRHTPQLISLWLLLSVPLVIYSHDSIVLVEVRKVVLALLIAALIVRLDVSVKAPKPLALLGRSGFSLYAFHAPIIYTLLILGWPWWLTIVAAIGFGLLSYAWIETTSIAWGRSLIATARQT
jgi:peptidoglycan/LPS O-acetylase OafA/YrhL